MARVDPGYVFGTKRTAAASKAAAVRGKYPWDTWLGVPWERPWILVQDEDFPGVKAESFLQAARNAALRRRLRLETELVDEHTVAIRVLGERE